MQEYQLKVEANDSGTRLDVFVSSKIEEISRVLVTELIRNGQIEVDGAAKKPSYKVVEGEVIGVRVPPPKNIELTPQDIPVTIVYQDNDLAVIDKPQGMVVHPAQGNWDKTLVNALLYQLDDLSGINGELRPGIVHRIDKDTSGLLVVAKNDQAHRCLSEQIKNHDIVREYIALVHGLVPQNMGRIEAPIGRSPKDRKKMAVVGDGRMAITNYQVLKRFKDFSLVKCRLETGRTHQIRVHMAYLGHPIAGDLLYGPRKNVLNLNGQALHATQMEFEHPTTGQHLTFDSPIPTYFSEILEKLPE
ncbi:MAG: RluA family pseudouridine synthase [Acidobacteriota bacterium]